MWIKIVVYLQAAVCRFIGSFKAASVPWRGMFSMRLRLRLHERTGAITHAPLYIRNSFSQSSLRRSGVVRCSTACHSSTRLSSAVPGGRTWLAAHGLHAVSPPPQPLNSDGTITNEPSLDKVSLPSLRVLDVLTTPLTAQRDFLTMAHLTDMD